MEEPASARPFTLQVGGHKNSVLTTEDDMLLIKQALPVELEFYRTIAAATQPQLAALQPFIPKFLGTLTLEGELDTDKPSSPTNIPIKPVDGPRKDKLSLVLENLARPFDKPNILDIKLGTVLYDDSAPPDKAARMVKVAATTTTGTKGMRLTGFQVYDNAAGTAVFTDKSYGKSISVAQLPEGITRFFPIVGVDAPTCGLPAPLLLQILELLREDIEDIREVLAALEMRMVGASLLILYESDAVRAEEGLKWMLRDEDEEAENSEDEQEEDDDDDEDESKPRKPSPPYDLRLIDFAHTRFVPGQGPDEGVLLGLDTLLGLIEERIVAVKNCA